MRWSGPHPRLRSVIFIIAGLLAASGLPRDVGAQDFELDLAEYARVRPLTFDDPLVARARAVSALKGYYMSPFVRYGGFIWVPFPGEGSDHGPMAGESCDADRGHPCFFGDPDALVCPHGFIRCKPRRDGAKALLDVIQVLEGASRSFPGDAFLVGQAVYVSLKGHRTVQALEIARACSAADWWCTALEAYVLYDAGRVDDASALVLRAVERMPVEEACWWNDISSLLPSDVRRVYEELDCTARAPIEERAWWLADPLYMDEWNDRRIAHLMRKTEIRLHEDLWSLGREPIVFTNTGWYRPDEDWREYQAFDGHISHHELDQALGGHHQGVVAIGFADSWFHDPDSPRYLGRYFHWRQWVSKQGARYRFFPSDGAYRDIRGIDVDEWDFADGKGWERYTPEYGRFTNDLSETHALFRRGDSIVVALATDLERNRLLSGIPKAAGLVLARNERDPPTVLFDNSPRDRYVFRATRPAGVQLLSLEVVSADYIGRLRFAVEGPWTRDESVSASDILLFEPSGAGLPDSLEAAVPLMKGSSTWTQGDELGLFWEIYDLPPGAPARVSVRIDGARSGFLGRLGDALRLTRNDGLEVAWTDAPIAPAVVEARSITIDLASVAPGEKVVEIRLEVDGRAPVVRTATIVVRERRER